MLGTTPGRTTDGMAKVEIYTRQFCGYCAAALSLLRDKGVELVERDATLDAGLRAEMVERSGGGRTFPQILIDGRPIGGYDELYALEAQGELDALLAGSTKEATL